MGILGFGGMDSGWRRNDGCGDGIRFGAAGHLDQRILRYYTSRSIAEWPGLPAHSAASNLKVSNPNSEGTNWSSLR